MSGGKPVLKNFRVKYQDGSGTGSIKHTTVEALNEESAKHFVLFGTDYSRQILSVTEITPN